MAGEYVVHESEDTLGEGTAEPRIIAEDIEIADSGLSQMRGLMFRSEIPEALVMEVGGGFSLTGGPPRQFVHMLFVRQTLDVIWLAEDEVRKVAQMRPWRSVGMAKADRILELPAGAADGVEVGDTVQVVDGEEFYGQ
jgi:uncharacterized membrane protein (UPF0127 family)